MAELSKDIGVDIRWARRTERGGNTSYYHSHELQEFRKDLDGLINRELTKYPKRYGDVLALETTGATRITSDNCLELSELLVESDFRDGLNRLRWKLLPHLGTAQSHGYDVVLIPGYMNEGELAGGVFSSCYRWFDRRTYTEELSP